MRNPWGANLIALNRHSTDTVSLIWDPEILAGASLWPVGGQNRPKTCQPSRKSHAADTERPTQCACYDNRLGLMAVTGHSGPSLGARAHPRAEIFTFWGAKEDSSPMIGDRTQGWPKTAGLAITLRQMRFACLPVTAH